MSAPQDRDPWGYPLHPTSGREPISTAEADSADMDAVWTDAAALIEHKRQQAYVQENSKEIAL